MRPTKYSKEILDKAKEYLLIERPCDDIITKVGKVREVIPTIEGLALFIDIARSTIYDWVSQDEGKEEFSDIVSQVLEKQGLGLVNGGLDNTFNSKIASVILSKHGYREAKEITGADGKDLFNNEQKEASKKAVGEFLDEDTK